MTQTKQQRYQQNKKYSQTENGKKTIKFASWRKQGLDGDYEKIYRRYMRTTVVRFSKVLGEIKNVWNIIMQRDSLET